MTPESVWDIKRNDISACVAYHEAHGVTPDEARVMYLLQDDPLKLSAIMATWDTVDR